MLLKLGGTGVIAFAITKILAVKIANIRAIPIVSINAFIYHSQINCTSLCIMELQYKTTILSVYYHSQCT